MNKTGWMLVNSVRHIERTGPATTVELAKLNGVSAGVMLNFIKDETCFVKTRVPSRDPLSNRTTTGWDLPNSAKKYSRAYGSRRDGQ